jgi:diaminohydroxyphosphoribosylaminopyrimidine deaminase/5-amino-6-(5-phosphoribosylamino)uracil reductase
MTSGVPRVVVKMAASLDGRIALANGASRWITGDAARADVQRLRAASSAVLTGVETVLADDPRLTVRDPQIELLGRQPLRVVLDSRLRTPASAKLLSEPGETLVLTDAAIAGEATELRSKGAIVHGVPPDARGRVDLQLALRELAQRQCNDVLVEAGPTLAGRFLELGLADELIVYLAPILLGPDARPMLNLPLIDQLADGLQFAPHSSEWFGPDLKLVLHPQRGH